MTQIKNTVLAIFSAIGTIAVNALGGWDNPMRLLAGLMSADYTTGVLLATVWKRSPKTESGKASSEVGFKGLLKKGMILLVVWIGAELDKALGVDYVRNMVILFFAGNEGISLMENLGLMGVPFPDAMKKMFEALHERGDKGKENAE